MGSCIFGVDKDRQAVDVVRLNLMLRVLHGRQNAEAGKEDARFALQKRIQALDDEIDARVYRLHGLTEEEIRVVEGRNSPA